MNEPPISPIKLKITENDHEILSIIKKNRKMSLK